MKRIFCLLAALVLTLQGCRREDDLGPAPKRDYSVQYATDIATIEEFLKTHSYEVVNNPGGADDMDVSFEKVEEGDPAAIWNSPNLMYRIVKLHDIEYKMYYLKLREGGGALNDKPSPCNVDAVLASYVGRYLFYYTDPDTNVTEMRNTIFETNPHPQSNFNLESVIKGWSETFPQFRAGDFLQVDGQPTQYSDFGAGVMFIPSGLGYYNQSQTSIPAYSCLVFSFKLYEVTRLDQDQDGIPSYLEDLDGDGYMYALPADTFNPDDTDGDLAPDYLDLDDDGDFVKTVVEIQDPENEDETIPFEDVPSCSGDTTTPNRLRKYRDPNCQ